MDCKSRGDTYDEVEVGRFRGDDEVRWCVCVCVCVDTSVNKTNVHRAIAVRDDFIQHNAHVGMTGVIPAASVTQRGMRDHRSWDRLAKCPIEYR